MRTRRSLLCFALLLLVVGMTAIPLLRAQDLVIDLSAPVVAITAGFSGTDVLLFGTTKDEGDVVVVVRGPQQSHIVRKSERVGGIWVNTADVTFADIPAYYSLAANRPIAGFVRGVDAGIHQIGVNEIIFNPAEHQKPVDDITQYKDALIRLKQKNGLYSTGAVDLAYLGNGLFRTNVHFPANVAVGTYGIDVYLFRDGKLVENRTSLLNVRKFGIEAEIYNFAHRHSVLYGIFAVIVAGAAGWLANAAFRKG